MKLTHTLLIALALTTVFISSCSKCYDCTYEYEIESNGTTTTETGSDDFCTASGDELEEKEDDGYTCTAK